MFKDFFVPTESNNYTPKLLAKKIMFLYLAMLVLVNFSIGALNIERSFAAVEKATILELHNQERAKQGLSELRINTLLTASATKKAEAMLASDCWSHYCPDGKSPWTFFDDSGYNYVYAGENLAEGFDTDESVMTAWLNSPTHKANVINENFDEVGIGFAYGDFQGIENNTIIVMHFGSRNNSAKAELSNGAAHIQNDKQISITDPVSGTITSDANIGISGLAPNNSNLKILDNNEQVGDVSSEGGIFTYRSNNKWNEGYHTFSATAYDEYNNEIGKSEFVDIEIDTTKPTIFIDSLNVKGINYGNATENSFIHINTSPDVERIETNVSGGSLQQLSPGSWEIELPVKNLSGLDNLRITALDKADNQSVEEVSTAKLISDITRIRSNADVGETESRLSISAYFFKGFLEKGTKVQVNLFFMLFLGSLLGIDFYVINKTGLTGIKRSKSHLHLSSITVLLIIGLIGGLSGQVLTGLAN